MSGIEKSRVEISWNLNSITFIWHLKTVFVQIIFRRNFGEISTSQLFLWSWGVEIISGGEFVDFFELSWLWLHDPANSGFPYWKWESSFVGKKKHFCTNVSFFVQYTWQNFGSQGLRLVKRSTQLLTSGVRSCVGSPFSRCTPVLDWSE